MHIDFLLSAFQQGSQSDSIVWKNQTFKYEWLLDKISSWTSLLNQNNVKPGTVIALEGDFSPNLIAMMLALIERECIIVPLLLGNKNNLERLQISMCQIHFQFDTEDNFTLRKLNCQTQHPLYIQLKKLKTPGLVLFSSGSSGHEKASVHNLSTLLEKYKTKRKPLRLIAFLQWDHIGGLNTLFYSLSNCCCLILIPERSPEVVFSTIETHSVELLPTTPTFLNLVLLSEIYLNKNYSSLKHITYGTEVMPEILLKKLTKIFNDTSFLQTYGLTETGILKSKSMGQDSLFVKIGGENFKQRVVNGMLELQSPSLMLGYLNAPNPFTEDGWFMTGDFVEQDGEYLRFLGRMSDVINVGGEKVHPPEVESIIQQIPEIENVCVFGERNSIIGNIVCANVKTSSSINRSVLTERIISHCEQNLQKYKIPIKITYVDEISYNNRFKKNRKISL